MNQRPEILKRLVTELKHCNPVLAVWEGGSAANATSDQYSDIDICVLASDPISLVFQTVESALNSISEITHIWNEPKSIWPGLTQKVYFLKDVPKHFFIDVAVFPEHATELAEFMQLERHGNPVVHFDKLDRIKTHHADKNVFAEKHRKRLKEIVEAFPVYRTEVFKELDRGHAVDAFAFYQGGMVKPLIEILGMIYRPFQFDFGFRYLQRSLPLELYRKIETLLYVQDMNSLRERATEVEKIFYDTVTDLKQRGE
jgi:predicted nucleotidyltransferase